jgi:hypothetical protein
LASYDIDHLGIVAGVSDEIGIIEEIDALLGNHKRLARQQRILGFLDPACRKYYLLI